MQLARINQNKTIIALFCATTGLSACTGEPPRQTSGIDEEAQLPYWQISDEGMSLRLVQRLPMQTRGFFMARGFSAPQVERVAQSCVFQTVFKNISHKTPHASPLSYDLSQWVVKSNGHTQGLKLREQWAEEWRAEKVGTAQQLAFEWSLYPTVQQYKPGDYNWGMSTFNLKPGSRFDLHVAWQQFGETRRAVIKNMQCSPDINPQSQDKK